jgi:hypothetical protein
MKKFDLISNWLKTYDYSKCAQLMAINMLIEAAYMNRVLCVSRN